MAARRQDGRGRNGNGRTSGNADGRILDFQGTRHTYISGIVAGGASVKTCHEELRQLPPSVRNDVSANHLLGLSYDCVILDEAHRARRRNLGPHRDGKAAQANNLLGFMYRIAERTRTLLLASRM